jgi:hypothetical protein
LKLVGEVAPKAGGGDRRNTDGGGGRAFCAAYWCRH